MRACFTADLVIGAAGLAARCRRTGSSDHRRVQRRSAADRENVRATNDQLDRISRICGMSMRCCRRRRRLGRRLRPRNRVRARWRSLVAAAGPLRVAVGRGEEEEAGEEAQDAAPRSRRARRRLPDAEPESDEASSDEKTSSRGRRRRRRRKKQAEERRRHRRRSVTRKRPPRSAGQGGARRRPRKPRPKAAGGAPIRAADSASAARRCSAQLTWTDDAGAGAVHALARARGCGSGSRRIRPRSPPTASPRTSASSAASTTASARRRRRRPGQTLTTKYQDFLAGPQGPHPARHGPALRRGRLGMQKFALEPFDPAGTRPNFNYAVRQRGRRRAVPVHARARHRPRRGLLVRDESGLLRGRDQVAPAVSRARPPTASTRRCPPVIRVISMIGVRLGVDFRQFGVATGWRMHDTAHPRRAARPIATSARLGRRGVGVRRHWAAGRGERARARPRSPPRRRRSRPVKAKKASRHRARRGRPRTASDIE